MHSPFVVYLEGFLDAMKKKTVTNAMRILTAAKIDFETVEYEAESVDKDFGVYIASLTGIDEERSFKTLVAKGDKTGYIVGCIGVACELDLKKLAAVSGNKRVELVAVKDIRDITGYIRGGVSPVGMKKKYPTYINASADGFDWIAVSGGVCGITLKLSPADLIKVTEGKLCDITK